MSQHEIQSYLAEWRTMEDQFYRMVLNDTQLYMLGIRLVRAVADSLKEIGDLETLIERFQRSGSSDVIPIADALEAPQVVLLDYQLALATAFYVRAQEIRQDGARAAWHARLAGARASGQSWVVIYDHEAQRNGHTFFERLEMRLPDGLSLRTASELDWERGRVYVVEPLLLDPITGQSRRGVASRAARQEFATREEMLRAAEDLRRGAGQVSYATGE